ncbi:MAG: preprotein translocase subunit SecE [Christensenellales bacterium]|jgi:preprotein translocase subunit SecE
MAKKYVVDKKKKPEKKKRRSLLKFFKEVIAELKKCSWPTKKELISYTGAVLAFVVLMAVVVGVIDIGLGELLKLVI